MNNFIPNGLVSSEAPFVAKVLDQKRWSQVEGRTRELLSHIQPNYTSEGQRNVVVSYLRSLIMSRVPCQIFPFGSVPLKTYLPDGDIDLTAFCDHRHEDRVIQDILHILKREENNEDAHFQVKEVQWIRAKVNIIKCFVANFLVDISFNQIGGLGTLCFIEEVDNLINQNHLLKRSIILIKAWCFYESRILGSYHGLISTYALETLVIYVFHVYSNIFAGPLEVLYRFLDFFSKFDWSKYCISLRGPVPIKSLPRMRSKPPRKDYRKLLLSQQFLDACESYYGVLCSSKELRENPFVSKYMSIVDPLIVNNNIGGSIRKGNFCRIKSAIALGAKRIERLLNCPEDKLIAEFDLFFMNTWERNGKGHWIDSVTYNLYIRNRNATTSREHNESDGIYQNPSNHSEESKQMLGTSDEFAASQTWRSRNGSMFTGTMAFDMQHRNTHYNALANRGQSPIGSSYEVLGEPYFPGFYSSSEFGRLNSEASIHHYYNPRTSSERYQPFGQIPYDWRNEYEDGYYCEYGSGGFNNENVCFNEYGFPYFDEYPPAPVNVNSCVPFPPPHAYMHGNSFGPFREDAPSFGYFPGYNMPHYHNTAPFPSEWFPARPFYEGEFAEPFDYGVSVPHSDHQRQMAVNHGSSKGSSSKQKGPARGRNSENPPDSRIIDKDVNSGASNKMPMTMANTSVPCYPPLHAGPSSSRQGTVDDQRFRPSFQVPPMFPFNNLPTQTDMHAGFGNLYPPESSVSSRFAHHVPYTRHHRAATSGYFVDGGYDILDGDFLSHWLNLQYGRFCKNQISKQAFPSSSTQPMHSRPQFAGHRRPQQGTMNIMERGQTPVPEMPYGEVSPLHGDINELAGFWLPRTSDGTGTYFPKSNPYQSQPNFSKKKRLPQYIESPKCEKKDKHSERDENLRLNSTEMFPSLGQLYGKSEKPGSSESSHRGESSTSGTSEVAKSGSDSESTKIRLG